MLDYISHRATHGHQSLSPNSQSIILIVLSEGQQIRQSIQHIIVNPYNRLHTAAENYNLELLVHIKIT